MPLLRTRDRQVLKTEFEKLNSPVKLLFFTQGLGCETCPLTAQLLAELAGLDDRITVETVNQVLDQESSKQYHITRVPAIVPLRCEIVAKDGETQTIEHDYGIRFYGLPSGYEFSSLIGIVLDVSRGDSGLNPQSRAALHELAAPLHIQVFSTPT